MRLKILAPILLAAMLLVPSTASPDITITAANVAWVSGTINRSNNAGTTVTAGQVVYLAASNKWLLAQCAGTASEAGTDTIVGIALHPSADGQPLAVQTDGVIKIGGTVAVGQIYVISATAGGIDTHANLVSTNRLYILGVGLTTSTIGLGKTGSIGVAIP